ncbi:hypothetical protein [Reichenbachiella sp. MSK19-1]|uniref:hypothetical protein n=1 Tax=Reichenbachiella sp. MSK19-1 TaxID=1897631 RepID=UPI000E6CD1BD|nr:hypothetical protein [Reichenbachiella sp. MSK19-1]RJE71473.1 hypothetical protein BGP76_05065 [Reichenbachiella sp. MSK19-1]
MKKHLFTLVLLTFFFATQAQDQIITAKMDTLVGKVLIQTGGEYQADRVSVKVGKKKHRFGAAEVREIQKKDQKYVTVKFRGRYQFMEVEQEGSYLNLYRYADPKTNTSDYAGQLLVTADGRQHIVSNIGFKKRLLEFLTECEDVSAKLESGEYNKSDLDQTIIDYNACIDQKSDAKEQALVAKKDASKISTLIELVDELDRDDQQELLDMLGDVESKLEAGDQIPSYLQSAIREKLAGEKSLLALFNEAVK